MTTIISPRPPTPRRLLRLLRRLAIGLLLALAILGSVGVIYQAAASAADRRAFPPPGQLIDVGGHRLHLFCTGEAAPGRPAIVLEALAGGFSSQWGWVQPELARRARVCSYDRAGYGWSEPAPELRGLGEAAADLHTLLELGGVEGPYLLVAHSIGGLYVRQFAVQYPSEVAGLVLLDASHPRQLERHPEWLDGMDSYMLLADAMGWLNQVGVGHAYFALGGEIDFAELPERQHGEIAAAWASPEYWRTIRAHDKDAVAAIYAEAAPLGSLRHTPLLVISADTGQAEGWTALQADLATLSTRAEHLVIAGASHVSLAFNPGHAGEVSVAIAGMLDRIALGGAVE
jgi:pimeloyl-ACP methyl ester carboxylesterase